MDKIGVITITFNSEPVLNSFLHCILNQTYTNFILYIIDNKSTDHTIKIIEEIKDSRIKLIKNERNEGVAKANNQGIKNAIADGCSQLLIINNDVEFEPQLINKLIKAQAKNKSSMIAPKIMYSDNPKYIWYAGAFFSKINGYLPLHRGFRELDIGKFNKVEEVQYAPTCCLLIKKEVFNDIGFMDEKYFVYFDDTDFCYRVYQSTQHNLVYYPNIEFYHKVGALTNKNIGESNAKYKSDFFLQQNIKNHIYFLRKIGSLFCYIFIIWLFLRNNIKFVFNPNIRKNFKTWVLMNKSYLQGFLIKYEINQ